MTAAGEELQGLISTPINDIGQALEALNRLRDEPAGRIRLNVLSDGAKLLLGAGSGSFYRALPDIEIDLTVTNKMVDIIGDDCPAPLAGYRLGSGGHCAVLPILESRNIRMI